MKLYFKFFNLLFIPFLITGAAFSDINKTTDRYIRDKYGCMITTQDGIKPKFSEKENVWVSSIQGYADLNQDTEGELGKIYQAQKAMDYFIEEDELNYPPHLRGDVIAKAKQAFAHTNKKEEEN